MRVVVAGGGTAGHVFPAVALADELRSRGHEVAFIGSADGQEARLVPEAGYPFHAIRVRKMERRISAATASAPFVAIASVARCRPLVAGADTVVGVGGYVSAPPVLAARSTRTRVLLHEQNAVPGLANRLLARLAEVVALSFADAAGRLPRRTPTVVTGNPVRASILAVPSRRAELRSEAVDALGLAPDRTTVGVFGGSQGALQLDRTVAGAIEELADRDDLQLLVLTGPAHGHEVEPRDADTGGVLVRTVPFLERIELALAVSDLAVSRAGSGHLAELAVSGVPAIVVPYPHATEGHQEANARELERAGACEVALERDLTPGALASRIAELVDRPDRRASMAAAAAAWARPHAAERLAALVEGSA